MKNMDVTRTSTVQRSSIEDLSTVGSELSDEHLQLASGGMMILASYQAASCTLCNDTDYHRCD